LILHISTIRFKNRISEAIRALERDKPTSPKDEAARSGFFERVCAAAAFAGRPLLDVDHKEVPMTRHTASLAPASGLAIVSRTVRTALGQLGSVVKAVRHRREVRHLAELDERILKDIGLSRTDVDGALSEPFYRNPSTVLVRAHAHRSRVQGLARRDERVRPVVPLVNGALRA
jgi:uncharacterized protein YjiS (DUF1127 family)